MIDDTNALVLDSFAGSGTTAHAVLNMNRQDGGNRRFILVEMEDYADSITAERVRRVIKGYGDTPGTGGGFSYYELGAPLFLEDGSLNEEVGTEKLREYVWYMETRRACQKQDGEDNKYLRGVNNGAAYYFYYEKDSSTTLNNEFIATIGTKAESYLIYADKCSLSAAELSKFRIVFKKIPRDIARL